MDCFAYDALAFSLLLTVQNVLYPLLCCDFSGMIRMIMEGV